MSILDIIDGCLDSGDVPSAAAAVLAHPSSRRLDRATISKFFQIAFCGASFTNVDAAMVSLMGTVARIDEEAIECR
jgi:hypothetical protein